LKEGGRVKEGGRDVGVEKDGGSQRGRVGARTTTKKSTKKRALASAAIFVCGTCRIEMIFLFDL